MIVFTCKDDFESMMTCIYDAWSARLGHSNIRLQTEPVEIPELFCEYLHVEKDREKAEKVISAIRRKISVEAYRFVYTAAMSKESQKLDSIYRFLVLGFSVGRDITSMLTLPAVSTIFQLQRKVTTEAHHFKEFIRFSRLKENSILYAQIEPEHHILTLISSYFSDRMPSENWMILDQNRNIALIHPADSKAYLKILSEAELDLLKDSRISSDLYSSLWKTFFHAVSVEARTNYSCQRNFLPLKFRKNMTEFQS